MIVSTKLQLQSEKEHGHSVEDGLRHLNQRQLFFSKFSQLLLKAWIIYSIIAIIFGYSYFVSRNSYFVSRNAYINLNNFVVVRLEKSGIVMPETF